MNKHITLIIFIHILFFSIACSNKDKNKTNNSSSNKTSVKKDAKKSASAAQLNKAAQLIAGVSATDIAAVNAAAVFKKNCASCHGLKGDMALSGAKKLTESTASLVEKVAQIYHGKGLMIPYKNVLKDAEIIAVAKYVEQLR